MFERRKLNVGGLTRAAMVRAKTSAIPPKMYRHFALVTVAVTASIAMFANGENREAVAAQIAQHRKETQVRPPSAPQFGTPTVSRAARQRPEFADDLEVFDGTFGRPTTRTVAHFTHGALAKDVAVQASYAGYSEEYLASLSEDERALLLKGLADQGMLTPAERSRKSAALNAASLRRSGASQEAD